MKTSDETDKINTAFIAAQAELKNAAFDKVNPHFKSKYATLAGMRDDVVPVLVKHGLGVIQGADMDCIVTRLIHTSGQWIEGRYPFTIDKPQQMGSAMTYARRYSLAAICGIASEEDDDGNVANQTPANDAPKIEPKAQGENTHLVKEAFTKIDSGLNTISQTGNLEDLKSWWTTHQDTINKLPANYKKSLTEKKDEIKTALTAKAA